MRLVELEVRNVRSYRHAIVRFAPGITLLSGDIGAGKSTLLHAIEFALFGLARGELTGGGLLRHGAADGEVRLSFTLEGHSHTIVRTLKRSRGAVAQDTGWFETDGVRESLTPQELRARVFGLLGYPLHFLAKQRNLIYRATVYTPQEEMKAILQEAPQERLETIRRLFGLDAYRIARENAQLVARALRDRETAAEEMITRLTQEAAECKARLTQTQEILLQREGLLQYRTDAIARQERAETGRREAEDARAAAFAVRSSLAMAARERATLTQEIARHEQAIVSKRRALEQASIALAQARERRAGLLPVDEEPDALRARQEAARVAVDRLRQDEGRLLHILEECAHGPNVAAGTPCPTCQQVVSAEHLTGVRSALDSKGVAARARLARVRADIAQATVSSESAAATLERARAIALVIERIGALEEGEATAAADVARLDDAIARLRAQLAALPVPVDETALAERLREAEARLGAAVEEARLAGTRLLEVERALARVDAAQETLVAHRDRLLALETQIIERAATRDAAAAARSWLVQRFSPLTEAIERRVLAAVHGTFDAAFRSLLAQLLEDDAIGARIDASFTPLLTQDGYETDVAFLSGGERTAVSLAYRLALVRAVHALLPHLGTAGVVLLDEPTDGFSREQLERVSGILRSLGAEQLLLVSHDPVLEGFADRVTRIGRSPDGSWVVDEGQGVTADVS